MVWKRLSNEETNVTANNLFLRALTKTVFIVAPLMVGYMFLIHFLFVWAADRFGINSPRWVLYLVVLGGLAFIGERMLGRDFRELKLRHECRRR